MSFKEGMKASLIASLAYMAIEIPYIYYTYLTNAPLVIAMIGRMLPPNSPYTPEELYRFMLTTIPVAIAVTTVAICALLGLIYPSVERRLRGMPVIKGITFSLIVWAVLTLIPSVLSPNILTKLGSLSVSLLASLCYGVILGPLFERFSR